MSHFRVLRLLLSIAIILPAANAAGAHTAPAGEPGFLVLAPDRGFLGNEETRDAYEAFAAGRKAAIVFVTDDRTRGSLDTALASLAEGRVSEVVVLPFFLSRSDPRFRRVEALLTGPSVSKLPVVWAGSFGESYFAVEALAERLRRLKKPENARLIVVGAGATDEESRTRMLPDWQRLADLASAGMGFESVRVVVETSPRMLPRALAESARGCARALIVPFHLGSKLDGMMSYTALVQGAVPANAEVADVDLTPDPTIAVWMAREANRRIAPRPEDVGVVVLAHGSDHHWNETMREAVAPLAQRYKIEPAFSMADPVVIERAIRRLEARGARFIVVLRVFGLASSFRGNVERLIGLDVERGDPPDPHAGHLMGHESHGRGRVAPPARIRSAAVLTTVGGLEDDPLFAEALLGRARVLSREPARETIILVAHGDGDDAANEHWLDLLRSLAARMRDLGADRFRAIRTATWREDWPDKRKPAVEQVRSFVEEAVADGGRALVIPARTLGRGPERELLGGLAFDLGEGFAPHPLFARWAAERVAAAVSRRGEDAREGRETAPAP